MLIVWHEDDEDTHDGFGHGHQKRIYNPIYIPATPRRKKKLRRQVYVPAPAPAPFTSEVLARADWIDGEIAAMLAQLPALADQLREVARLESIRQAQALGDLQDALLQRLQALALVADRAASLDADFMFLLTLLLDEDD